MIADRALGFVETSHCQTAVRSASGKACGIPAGFRNSRPGPSGHLGEEEIGVSGYRAIFNYRVIAQSSQVVLLEGNVYFPTGSVRQDFLQRSRAKSLCPWKGIASYYTVTVDGQTGRNAAWTYRHPSPLARRIKNHVAFWGGVVVEECE